MQYTHTEGDRLTLNVTDIMEDHDVFQIPEVETFLLS